MTDQSPEKNQHQEPEVPSESAEQDATTETPDTEAVDWQRPETWPREIGGKRGPEPTRYGDWESNGRCTDF
ncbi:DUF1674 domain-containing protein [Spiribacter vilamensis]|uniref:DUF1674 domain-containing protein n=1 Tax=Spiribacter vilamensis TaxID=531306 RepID=A0A4Q8CYT9_9GAMM|nr:DUF1674 domain-containing protein [Spiribacter vilamensis]RZU98176.1 hypothetical protein EV698_0417 [Spiribacter vilamensis]TVO60924.1 DUF1674 domain-containing protein [Spiribacter vilamensis]